MKPQNLQTLLIASAMFAQISARAGSEVTVLDNADKSAKSVVSTEDLKNPNLRVLRGWAINEDQGFKVDYSLIDASDADYASKMADAIIENSNLAYSVLVDKKTGNVLNIPNNAYPCIFTGVSGANAYCNHYGENLSYDAKNGIVLFQTDGKWDTRHLSVLLLKDQGDAGLTTIAYTAALLDLVNNQITAKLDKEHAKDKVYLEFRNDLTTLLDGAVTKKITHGAQVTLSFDAYRPKQNESFTGKLVFTVTSVTGEGQLVFTSK